MAVLKDVGRKDGGGERWRWREMEVERDGGVITVAVEMACCSKLTGLEDLWGRTNSVVHGRAQEECEYCLLHD